ncbi:MAG: AMP-binding protein [Planctomycetes bacterium]|nr:AMP-binding protein [Planctomycetota bacterium]
MSLSRWLVEHLTYPAHEWLRGRPTLPFHHEMLQLGKASREQVCDLGRGRLRELLCFAAGRLPHYTQQFERCGADPRAADPYAELAQLPVLEKADVRAHLERLVCRDVPGGLIPCSSGGTSGDTLHFFIDRVREAQPLACRLFMQGLFGVRPGDRRVYLWGSPIESRGSWVKRCRNRLLHELVLDAFDMGPAATDAHLATIRAFKPRLIYAYPTAAAYLAQRAARHFGPRQFRWLRLVVLTGEETTPDQLTQVRGAFGCAVAAEYGSREVGLIAHECPQGGLHIMSPHIHVEIVVGARAVPVGQAGEVLCTTLTTRAQPLIRYRLGDVGALVSGACACGLPFPLMRIVGGRTSGFVLLSDGRLCHGAVSSTVLRDEPSIVQFKTFQREVDHFEVLLVVNERFDYGAIKRVQQRYRALFGPQVRATCRVVDQIPPDPSGKRRHVVSDVAPNYAKFEVVSAPEAERHSLELTR